MSWRVVAWRGEGPWPDRRGLQVGDLVVVQVSPAIAQMIGAVVRHPLTTTIGEVVDLDVNRKGKLLRVHVQLSGSVLGPPVTVVRHPQRLRLTHIEDHRPRPLPALYLAAVNGCRIQEMIG